MHSVKLESVSKLHNQHVYLWRISGWDSSLKWLVSDFTRKFLRTCICLKQLFQDSLGRCCDGSKMHIAVGYIQCCYVFIIVSKHDHFCFWKSLLDNGLDFCLEAHGFRFPSSYSAHCMGFCCAVTTKHRKFVRISLPVVNVKCIIVALPSIKRQNQTTNNDIFYRDETRWDAQFRSGTQFTWRSLFYTITLLWDHSLRVGTLKELPPKWNCMIIDALNIRCNLVLSLLFWF